MSLSDSFLDPESLERSAADEQVERRLEDSIDFELRFYNEVLQRNPEYVDVLRCQGELLSRARRHADAVVIDRRLARLRPDDCIVRYNLACSLAQDKQPAEAIEQLRGAFELGYTDFAHLELDQDLDGLRHLPAYKSLLREFGVGN